MTLIVSYNRTISADKTISMGAVTASIDKVFTEQDENTTTYFAGCGIFSEIKKLRDAFFLGEASAGVGPETSGLYVRVNNHNPDDWEHGHVEYDGSYFPVDKDCPVVCSGDGMMLAATALIKAGFLETNTMKSLFDILNECSTINLSGYQEIHY